MTLRERVRAATERLERAGLSHGSAVTDAAVLARAALGCDRATYLARLHDVPDAGFERTYEALLLRREERVPVAQILGTREFWGRDFAVSPAVLTPRPETELIVEEALERFGGTPPRRLVDVGTGSGCLAVTLALELAGTRVEATDIAADALRVARENARRLGADGIAFVQTDLLAGIAPGCELIVSNPPYVPDPARPALSPEVRDYEPGVALFGGPDGLDTIRRLLPAARDVLDSEGLLLMEFGAGCDDEVRELVDATAGLTVDAIRDDLQGIPRVAVIRRMGR